jgi:hypothetical protein
MCSVGIGSRLLSIREKATEGTLLFTGLGGVSSSSLLKVKSITVSRDLFLF